MVHLKTNDLNKNNLFGKVQSTKTVHFNLKENYKPITEDKSNYHFYKQNIDYFNLEGYSTKSLIYDPKKIVFKMLWKYDSEGQKMSSKAYYCDVGLIENTYYEYNEDGFLFKESTGHAKVLYRYDFQGNLSEELFYDPDGDLSFVYYYTYDKSDRRIEHKIWNSSSDAPYDDRFIYKYDKNNNINEKLSYGFEDFLNERKVFKYTYDSNQNWIRKTEFEVRNNIETPKKIYEREINYY